MQRLLKGQSFNDSNFIPRACDIVGHPARKLKRSVTPTEKLESKSLSQCVKSCNLQQSS